MEELYEQLGRMYMTVVQQMKEIEQLKTALAQKENPEPDAD